MDRRNPECRPLLTLEDVLSWEQGHDDLCVASVPKRARKSQDVPKLLVCHDMKGGYLEDRLIQGCCQFDAYRFFHWQYVDTYVYFSHYFVTIPPAGWTNAAHKHGTSILGTLITEWDDGKARCEAFLQSEESYQAFADKLVQITKYYGFDGWLVNIENAIATEEMVTNLRGFVKYLTEEHHKHIPGSQVIWYDSVINTGELDWQNALNEKNSMFFEVSDGIFLNYCWKDEHLSDSKTQAVAVDRPYDVYVGIDVFGRGCLGDGGYNTCEALESVRNHQLSAAIFANGWVYETHGAATFLRNENKFWRLLHQYCHPCTYTTLPLNTSFCQGFGERFFDNGVPVGNPWWNISIQQLQPTFTNSQFVCNQSNENAQFPISQDIQPISVLGNQSPISPGNQSPKPTGNQPISVLGNQSPLLTGNESPMVIGSQSPMSPGSQPLTGFNESMELCTADAWVGGACLKLEADVANFRFVKFNLFSTDIELKQYSAVYVSVTYKVVQDPDCDIFLELHLQHDNQSIVLVLLPFPSGDKPVPKYGPNVASMYIYAMNNADLPKLLDPAMSQPTNSRWKTRWFPIHHLYLTFCKLKMVTVGMTTTDPQPKQCIIYLGDLKITPADSVPEAFPVAEMISTVADNTTSYPLLDINKHNYDKKEEQPGHMVDWGVDGAGNPVQVPYETLDKMRVSSNTLKEVLPGLGGNSCEVLYRLITSLDCFTLHWEVEQPDLIDHYRVYQIKIDSGVAKLLGHVTQPFYKVTWFEIPDYEKDENVHHFQCVIRPVMKNGIAVPLDYNYCKLFRIASSKNSVCIVKDVCTSVSEDVSGNVTKGASGLTNAKCGKEVNTTKCEEKKTAKCEEKKTTKCEEKKTTKCEEKKTTKCEEKKTKTEKCEEMKTEATKSEDKENGKCEEMKNEAMKCEEKKSKNEQCGEKKTGSTKSEAKKKDGKACDGTNGNKTKSVQKASDMKKDDSLEELTEKLHISPSDK